MQSFENHIVFLVKFISNDYLDSFVHEGQLFMNNIQYFREYESEDIALRGDPDEGLSATYNSENVTFELGGKELKALCGNIDIRWNHEESTNIFCMTAVTVQDIMKNNGNFKISEKFKKFGDKAVIIPSQNIKEFISRIEKQFYSNTDIVPHPKQKTVATKVEYISRKDHQGEVGVFRKYDDYKWQMEWRIAIKQVKTNREYSDFKIGSINDICFIRDTESLINDEIKINEPA